MKILMTVFVLLWAAGPTVNQSGTSANDRGSAAVNGGLALTASLRHQRYCSDGDMMLVLRLGYRNTGSTDLVLFKYAVRPYEYSISRSLEDTAALNFEKVINPTTGFMRNSMKLGDRPPSEYFVTLKPGETYSPDFDTILPIFLRKEGESQCEPTAGGGCDSGLGSGRHVLQLSVRTWPLHNNPEPALLSRWRQYGEVWSKPLLSQPFPFEVELPYKGPLTNCNAPAEQ